MSRCTELMGHARRLRSWGVPALRAVLPYLIGGGLVATVVVGVPGYGASQHRAGVNTTNFDHILDELNERETDHAPGWRMNTWEARLGSVT